MKGTHQFAAMQQFVGIDDWAWRRNHRYPGWGLQKYERAINRIDESEKCITARRRCMRVGCNSQSRTRISPEPCLFSSCISLQFDLRVAASSIPPPLRERPT